MNPLTPVLCKVAAKSDGFLTGMLRDQGIDADFNQVRPMSEVFKNELGPAVSALAFAHPVTSFYPNAIATTAKVLGLATGHPGTRRNPGDEYVKWFYDKIGDPRNSQWKNMLYRISSSSDGKSPGTWGIGPAITSLIQQFNPWGKPDPPKQDPSLPSS
jgi:hypothetical protein